MKKGYYFSIALFLTLAASVTAGDKKGIPSPINFSSASDYFRSAQSGNWGTLTTWESSPDNGVTPWAAATLIPTSAASIILIRNTHTVTVAVNQNMDEVIIESGGILFHTAGTLTVNDGAGDDILVQSGGIFTLGSNSNGPVFSGSATANINTGAILRLSASGLTNAGAGVNASNFIYNDASVLEYTLSFTAFSTAGVTYFPNANASTIPIFRITGNVGTVGGATPTVFNGLFEVNGSVTFDNTATKTFRNGITGTGNITGSASGKFLINGTTAKLGGTGSLVLPTVAGMDIGSNTTVTMVSNKSVTGNIALLTNALVILGPYNLTMTGDVSGGSATSHIVTDGSGKLVINNITGATPRIFTIGANASTFNPMAISNGGGLNYGIRVVTGISPGIAYPANAVNRTWFVTPSGGTPGTVNTSFGYYPGDGNSSFNYSANLELGHYVSVWNVIQTNLSPVGMYQVATTVSSFGNNIEAPLVLGNLGAILSADESVIVNYFNGIKQNTYHLLNWKLTCNNTAAIMIELQHSIDARNYNGIYSLDAAALQCRQSFSYTDSHPVAGANYYRLKIKDAAGKIFYSTVVSLLHAERGFAILNIAPNPVSNGRVDLKISAAQNSKIEIVITDMQGRIMQQQAASLNAGFNTVPVDVSVFSPGIYQVLANSAGERSKSIRLLIR